MSAASRRCFDQLAADRRWHVFTAAERATVAAFVRRWKVRPGDRVLEPGCGSGRLTAVLATLTAPGGSVLAFDRSARFVRLARRRHLPAHIRFCVGSARSIRLAPQTFDQVICFNVYPHLVPPEVLVLRLVAALRPGGHFWIAHTCSRNFVNAIHRRGPVAIRDHLLPSPRLLRRQLRAAGLEEIEIDDHGSHFLAGARRPAPG